MIENGDRRASPSRMLQLLRHRGPDSDGVWQSSGVTIGHTRLAILDLSPQGHQPMLSADGRFVLSFNGELYNFREVRNELQRSFNCVFKSSGDTEVLLHALQCWGPQKTLDRIEGIFAFGLWDIHEQRLLLARDRFGIKPLVFGWADGDFFFASDLRVVKELASKKLRICPDGIRAYLRYGYIPAPFTALQSCYKLPAASSASFDREVLRTPKPYADLLEGEKIVRYWRYDSVPSRPHIGFEEAQLELEKKLKSSVASQMISDVPLGAFLSGGVDSSLVVSLMTELAPQRIKTFSIGFAESRYNEGPFAAAVARHLGTEHHELTCDGVKAAEVVPQLAAVYDEPFGDSSQIPTLLVSRLAREFVTVVLSGDGGDELFGGYPRYRWAKSFNLLQRLCPSLLRGTAAAAIESIGVRRWQKLFELFPGLVPRAIPIEAAGFSAISAARLLTLNQLSPVYDFLLCLWPRLGMPGSLEVPELRRRLTDVLDREDRDLYDRMTDWDLSVYLCDDILTKVDRASMWFGLEARVPLLSREVVELVSSLPPTIRYSGNPPKRLLRTILDKRVPAKLIDRPKQGFGAPVEVWLKGPLRDWAESMMPRALELFSVYLPEVPLREMWGSYQADKAPWVPAIWSALMLAAWSEEWSVSL